MIINGISLRVRAASAVVVAAGVVGFAASGSLPSAQAAELSSANPTLASSSAACPPSGLRVTPGFSDAALGYRVLQVVVENCSSEQHEVSGQPATRVLDDEQQPLDIVVTAGDTQPGPVVLAPGGRADVLVEWRNTVTDGDPVVGTFLEVSTGADTQVIKPEHQFDLGTTGTIRVGSWSPLTTS